MAKVSLLPAALLVALGFAPITGFAQEAAPEVAAGTDAAAASGAHPRGGQMGFARSPMIRLDFGAGRTISVTCGQTDITACVGAITPLAEKLAATPVAGPGKGHDGKGWKDRKAHHGKAHGKDRKDGRPQDREGRKPGADAPKDAPKAD